MKLTSNRRILYGLYWHAQFYYRWRIRHPPRTRQDFEKMLKEQGYTDEVSSSTHSFTRTLTHTHTHARTHTHTHARIHTRMHARAPCTHTRTHTQTHARKLAQAHEMHTCTYSHLHFMQVCYKTNSRRSDTCLSSNFLTLSHFLQNLLAIKQRFGARVFGPDEKEKTDATAGKSRRKGGEKQQSAQQQTKSTTAENQEGL